MLHTGGVRAERAADGPPNDEANLGAPCSSPFSRNPGGELKYLWMGVRPKFSAGAAEPILSKLLQGRKVNV